jgi:KaiC/GvpD/RAD55 family RecA-like ATPase
VPEVDFATMPLGEVRRMAAAARTVSAVERLLAKTGDTVVDEVLRGEGAFYEWRHYPSGDAFDPETGGQYYYHAHPHDERPREHGHFHVFLRPSTGDLTAGRTDRRRRGSGPQTFDRPSHLVAVAMDRTGAAIELFTTNKWVTDESWVSATEASRLLRRFAVTHARPSWLLNQWLDGLIRMYRRDIEALLAERDRVVADRRRRRPDHDVLEDRGLEVASFMGIRIGDRIKEIERRLGRRLPPLTLTLREPA